MPATLPLDLDRFRIAPGASVDLDRRPTNVTLDLDKHDAKARTKDTLKALAALQERLYAENTQSLLVVLQAMDAGGKDSTIRKVFGPLNPQGVHVHSFKAPSTLERSHDFLWRVHQRVPAKGHIGVFNRSHYEDVLIVRVKNLAPAKVVERRYAHINAFERLLADGGTRVVKIMLHVSKAYQAERLRRRLERPDKHWKFNPDDLTERARWNDYQRAFEIALTRCSTEAAPWYVIPAETRWFRDLAISQLLHETLSEMNPHFPPPSFDPAAYPPSAIP